METNTPEPTADRELQPAAIVVVVPPGRSLNGVTFEHGAKLWSMGEPGLLGMDAHTQGRWKAILPTGGAQELTATWVQVVQQLGISQHRAVPVPLKIQEHDWGPFQSEFLARAASLRRMTVRRGALMDIDDEPASSMQERQPASFGGLHFSVTKPTAEQAERRNADRGLTLDELKEARAASFRGLHFSATAEQAARRNADRALTRLKEARAASEAAKLKDVGQWLMRVGAWLFEVSQRGAGPEEDEHGHV